MAKIITSELNFKKNTSKYIDILKKDTQGVHEVEIRSNDGKIKLTMKRDFK